MTANRFIETGEGLTVTQPSAKDRVDALHKRLDALLRKEGEGAAAAPAGDGPTTPDVHVPTADMQAGPRRKKPKAKKGTANG